MPRKVYFGHGGLADEVEHSRHFLTIQSGAVAAPPVLHQIRQLLIRRRDVLVIATTNDKWNYCKS
jgi:hypothetical protein